MRTPFFLAAATVVGSYAAMVFAAFLLVVPIIGPILVPFFILAVKIASVPLTYFSTFVHESGHAVAALLVGGRVTGMGIALDGSGLTTTLTSGGFWPVFVVKNAGYMAGALYGSFALLWGNRFGGTAWLFRFTAVVTANCTLLFTIFAIGPVSPGLTVEMRFFALIVGTLATVALWSVPRFVKSEFLREYVAGLFAVSCLFKAFDDIWTVYVVSSRQLADNDASALGEMTGVPGPVWAVLWACLSAFVIWYSIRISRRPEHA